MKRGMESGFKSTILIDTASRGCTTLVDSSSGALTDAQNEHEICARQKIRFVVEYGRKPLSMRIINSLNVSVACGRLGSAHCRRPIGRPGI